MLMTYRPLILINSNILISNASTRISELKLFNRIQEILSHQYLCHYIPIPY